MLFRSRGFVSPTSIVITVMIAAIALLWHRLFVPPHNISRLQARIALAPDVITTATLSFVCLAPLMLKLLYLVIAIVGVKVIILLLDLTLRMIFVTTTTGRLRLCMCR